LIEQPIGIVRHCIFGLFEVVESTVIPPMREGHVGFFAVGSKLSLVIQEEKGQEGPSVGTQDPVRLLEVFSSRFIEKMGKE